MRDIDSNISSVSCVAMYIEGQLALSVAPARLILSAFVMHALLLTQVQIFFLLATFALPSLAYSHPVLTEQTTRQFHAHHCVVQS